MEKKLEEVKAKLLEMNELVSKLDPAIRAAAFDILRSSYFDETPQKTAPAAKKSPGTPLQVDTPTDLADFIALHDSKKPADNVMLLAAWLYSQYGTYPITAKEIKELGDSCGLVTPARSDNTMRQAKSKGKSLFNQQGKGWKPTISGELYLKETYAVKKGTKPLPAGE